MKEEGPGAFLGGFFFNNAVRWLGDLILRLNEVFCVVIGDVMG